MELDHVFRKPALPVNGSASGDPAAIVSEKGRDELGAERWTRDHARID